MTPKAEVLDELLKTSAMPTAGMRRWFGPSVGRATTAGSMFWFIPAHHAVNGVTLNKLRPHSPASTNAIHAAWAGLRDGNLERPRPDPDCGCK
jgi:hypothetical protein